MVGLGDPVGRVDRDQLVDLAAGVGARVVREHRLLGGRERGDRAGPAGPVGQLCVGAVAPDGPLEHQLVSDLGLADRAVPVAVGDREQRVQRGRRPGRVAHPDHEPAPGRVPVRPPGGVLGHRGEHGPPGQPLPRPAERGGPSPRHRDDDRRDRQRPAGPRQRGGGLRAARGQSGPDGRLGRPRVRPAASDRGAEGGRHRRRRGAEYGDRGAGAADRRLGQRPLGGQPAQHRRVVRGGGDGRTRPRAGAAGVPGQPGREERGAGEHAADHEKRPSGAERGRAEPGRPPPDRPARLVPGDVVGLVLTVPARPHHRCPLPPVRMPAFPGPTRGRTGVEPAAYRCSRAVRSYNQDSSGTATGEGQIVTRQGGVSYGSSSAGGEPVSVRDQRTECMIVRDTARSISPSTSSRLRTGSSFHRASSRTLAARAAGCTAS